MEGDPRGVRVAAVGRVPPGTGAIVSAEGATLAIFNVGGTYHAIDNACPHRGGPLGEGDLRGKVVTCPWHGWDWDVTTGANVNNPGVRIGCYPVTVSEGALYVRMVS
jgi:nitrite reductase/ring-hydroxylating ferredoxin subunit